MWLKGAAQARVRRGHVGRRNVSLPGLSLPQRAGRGGALKFSLAAPPLLPRYCVVAPEVPPQRRAATGLKQPE